MLMGHTEGLPEREHLLAGSETRPSSLDEQDDFFPEEILYEASFDHLSSNNLSYDTIIWLSISFLLVLAWGFGIFMLVYLPVRRFILQRDIASRRLFVTTDEIVLKISRPSFIPFCGVASTEKRVSLNMVIEVVIEQGFLQAIYGIRTFKVQSVAHGKASSVDELQVQGVDDPDALRSVIIREASKKPRETGKNWASVSVDNLPRMGSSSETAPLKSPLNNRKVGGSPFKSSIEQRYLDIMVSRIDEVMGSVKKLEILIQNTNSCSDRVEPT